MLTAPLREEGDALNQLLRQQGERLATLETQFKNWTGWDIVAHLHHADVWATAAATSPEDFNAVAHDVMAAMSTGQSLMEFTRKTYGDVAYPELLDQWWNQFNRMCDLFDATDPDVRLPWFGPPMKVRMFSTARQMETWAHSLALYDALGLERAETDRIQHIVYIGVRTYKFGFVNRQLPVPEPMPFLDLTAPSGERWTYGDASEDDFIRGSAVEFARVVTQTRNVADTALTVQGPNASAWMEWPQCFAGPPEQPPAPGTRFRVEKAA